MKRAAILAALLASTAAFAQYQVDTIRSSGPSSNRIDIVILGDGYTATDQAKFITDATNMTNALFAATPWKEYAGLFNVRAIHVVSNQNGGDQGTYGATRDTALGAYYYCASGIQRLLCVDDSTVYNIAAQATPDYDLLLVIVNDPLYGGSGGPIAVASTNASSNEILIHELGHTLGKLADEYESPYPGYGNCSGDCPEPNATLNATSTVKWKAWIPAGEPIPTPETSTYSSPIGVFEGCRYQSTGVYRPKLSACKMNALGNPYCSVCAEAMVKAFWNRVSMFDTKTPAANSTAPQCAPLDFSVTQPALVSPTYRYSWSVNDVPQSANGTSLSTSPTVNSVIQLKVQDATPLVRNDPTLLLEDSTSWTVSVTSGACSLGDCDQAVVCQGDGGCSVTPKSAGAACGSSTCTNGVQSAAASCDGAGNCTGNMVQTSCDPYQCDSAGVACRTSCTTSSQCASGYVCSSGACVAYVDAGTPDAGTADAGTPDAGQLDSGVVDAGAPDSGIVDSGVPDAGGFDAGTRRTLVIPAVPDGQLSEGAPTGCGCGAVDGFGAFAMIGFAGMLRRRRSGGIGRLAR